MDTTGSTIPHWKRIWRAVTGRSANAGPTVIADALKMAKDRLLEGIMFTNFTEDTFTTCIEQIKAQDQPDLVKFLHRLSVTLDLDAWWCWSLFNNYLMFECHDKLEDVKHIVRSQVKEDIFIIQVWQFYTLERTYLLRIIQYIIENYGNTSHRYHQQYLKFVDDVTFKKLRCCLFNQYSYLINEITKEKDASIVGMSNWVDRNNSELLQTLLIIISTIKHDKFDVTEFVKIFGLFTEHMVSPPPFPEFLRPPVVQSIQSAQLGLLVASIQDFWFNQDAWYSSIEDIEKIVKETCNYDSHAVILLVWATLQSTLPTDLASMIYEKHSHMYMSKALENFVFVKLSKVISDSVFKGTAAGVVANAAFAKLFDTVCSTFDAQNVYIHDGTVSLFGHILRVPELIYSWQSMEGLLEFFLHASALFPFQFEAFTNFMGACITSKTYDIIIPQLCNLKTYTEIYISSAWGGPSIRNNVTLNAYNPIKNDSIVFPAGAKAIITKQHLETLVTLHGSWSYFSLLRHIVTHFLNEVEDTLEYPELSQQMVISGYKLMLEILKVHPEFAWENPDLKKLLNLALCLLSTSTKSATANLDIMTICFEITIHIFKHDPADTVRALVGIGFLPKLSSELTAPSDFLKIYLLSNATLFHYIEKEFSDTKSCNLVLLYMQLVNEAKKMKVYYAKLQIPACMFLLVRVFPFFIIELFSENLKVRQVVIDLVILIHDIMKTEPKSEADPHATLYKYVMELFAHDEVAAKSLMKIFECGNEQLQLVFSTEMNWQCGPFVVIIETIERALECVLLVLKYIQLNDSQKYQQFPELLHEFTPPKFSVLKVIASYVGHCFNPNIPILACQIMTAVAKVSPRPLLYSLQVDDIQLQSLFLEHLRDVLDNQELRVAVVQLVTACVREQNSMTVGFFNMLSKKNESDISILNILSEYLSDIEENPNSLLIPIQGAILDLFHELWKNNKQHILLNIIEPESFWISLTTPLRKPNDVSMEILLQILEIVILELHFSKQNITEKFNKEFRVIFEAPNRFLIVWMNRLIQLSRIDAILTDSSRVPLRIAMLTIWRNFVLSVKLLNPEYYQTKWNTSYFVEKCLLGLYNYTEIAQESDTLTLWAELCLIFINFPVLKNNAERENIFNNTTKILKNVSELYERLTETCRTTLLTVITMVVTNFTEFLAANPSFIASFLTPLERIFYFEYRVTFVHKYEIQHHCNNWILILRIIRTFLTIGAESDIEEFFVHIRFVERMSEVIGLCIKHSMPLQVAQVTAITLVEFAESPWVRHFELYNRPAAYNQFLPPKTYLVQCQRMPTGNIPQRLKDWWVVYQYIVRLHCTLLRRRKGYAYEIVSDFMDAHKTVLADALISCTVLADTNLELVVDVLRFVHEFLEHKQKWVSCNLLAFQIIMGAIKEVLNTSIGIIARPQYILFVPPTPRTGRKHSETHIPHQYLINVMNGYLDIITWSCKCFARCNQPFSSLLNMYKADDCLAFVMNDFRVPATLDSMNTLTYGSLLAVLHYCMKALNQILYKKAEELTPRSLDTGGSTMSVGTSASVMSLEPVTTLQTASLSSVSGSAMSLGTLSGSSANTLGSPSGSAMTLGTGAASSATLTSTSTSTLTPEIPVPTEVNKEYSVIVLSSSTKGATDMRHAYYVADVRGLDADWLININADLLMSALNAVILFLAGQIFTTVRDDSIERNLKRYVKRELCCELSVYYDFVAKYLCTKYVPPADEQATPDTRIIATPRRTKIRSRDKSTKLVGDIMRICSNRPSGRKTEILDAEDCYMLATVHWFRHVCKLVHYSKFDEFLSRWHAKSTYVTPHSTFVKKTNMQLSEEEEDEAEGVRKRQSKIPSW